ncbi:nmrA-like family protein [Aspergillus campestris IBT 28561]|uniref:NmrA-like family protein n=1 Tax=Aspergillus campestris (strain IBT 28561) TaxID=1392248 RepID=A0A2I1DEV9_ASPC2|nr:nmrA-like family protein [Aspergillus campestris IBT 28561]PKY08423.1 nmrA-like family protein [Aspergillus campestris IBT 28561]
MTISILVTGATGKQGGGVVNALLAEDSTTDVEILAVTRNPDSASAQKLAAKSPKIKLVKGDLDEPNALLDTAKEVSSTGAVWGVFSVQPSAAEGASLENEVTQGKGLIDASITHNVTHFVYSSVDRGGETASAENATNVPHFITKHRIEQYLFERTSSLGVNMSWTVLRTVFFFDNLVPNFFGKVCATAWDAYLQGRPLQAIAVSDIGVFAAKAFLQYHDPRFRNQCLSLAGDELTFEGMQAVFQEKTGGPMPTTYSVLMYFVMWMVGDLRTMFVWFYEHGFKIDFAKLRAIHPGLKDLGTWLEEESEFVTKK